MPHDKTGQLIELNDVVTVPYYEKGALIQKSAVVKVIHADTDTCDLEVSVDHFLHQLVKSNLRPPTQLRMRLGGITQQ